MMQVGIMIHNVVGDSSKTIKNKIINLIIRRNKRKFIDPASQNGEKIIMKEI